MSNRDFTAFLSQLSQLPGVYQMLDEKGQVIYVGKAKNLRKRVASYFKVSHQTTKTARLVSQIDDIRVTVTTSEAEALLLECNLIKANAPKYNVLLRDDKSFPYIALNMQHDFPKLQFYRGIRRTKHQLYGPYPNAGIVKETLDFLQKIFLLRNCKDSDFLHRKRPCLQYQIKQCSAPCVGYISQEDYRHQVALAQAFLSGKSDTLLKTLESEMQVASKAMVFERAIRLRDQIKQLRALQHKQIVNATQTQTSCDVLAVVCDTHSSCVVMLQVRQGQLVASLSFFPKLPPEKTACPTLQTILEAFITQYYLGAANPHPPILLTSVALSQAFCHAFEAQFSSIKLKTAVRGIPVKWVAMAKTNASLALSQRTSNKQSFGTAFTALQEVMGLEQPILSIECFDISHHRGDQTMGSCVVFDSHGPVKSQYRKFHITGITPGDDYAAMSQVLIRRYQRLIKTEQSLPEVIMVDGGKGQIGVAKDVMQKLGIEEHRLLGIAKGEGRKPGLETLVLDGGIRQLQLEDTSELLHLLQQIRDEAHRFAITAHRKKREKATISSVLEDIEGIGSKRRQALLTHFGGLKGIKDASLEALMAVPGIHRALAEEIYAYLHQ